MPKNKIEDLRNLLFETMERLMDPDDPMDIKTATAVGDVAQVIVNSAKVETDFAKITGRGSSEFIQGLPSAEKNVTPLQIVTSNAAGELPAMTEFVPEEKLCQQCVLPACDDTSSKCLIKIQRRTFKEAA